MKKMKTGLHAPVLFLVFNRPAVTRQVFERIREAKPQHLFIAADGPRNNKPQDMEACAEVRDIVSQIDWSCNVRKLFRPENLGCKHAVSDALIWFFGQVEFGIILEDDCLPTHSFFYYCQELLEKYRHDTRIGHINGNNFNAPSLAQTDYSYHFTYLPQVWGWATWRRAFARYDVSMTLHKTFDHHSYFKHCGLKRTEYEKISKRWKRTRQGKIDTWDYQWHFVNMLEGNLAISPVKNQVTNLGFSGQATHSPRINPLKENLPTFEIPLPLQHPPCIFIDERLNKYYRNMMISETLGMKVRRKLLKQGIRLFR